MKPILLALAFLALPLPGSASVEPVVRVRRVGEKFQFELCKQEKCKTLGRSEGYNRAELEKWKQFRESKASEIIPIMVFAGAIALTIGSVIFFPLAGLTASAVALGGFSYFFSKSPQVQANMPNDVYQEFQANPALLPELKSFLLAIDQGEPVTDHNPRILSGRSPQKVEPAAESGKTEPAPSATDAR